MKKEKKYTIQEVRDIIHDFYENMNPYKRLDAADGIIQVQKLLERKQLSDTGNDA